jgi:diguanylate cyclase (GGDEF)-like protein
LLPLALAIACWFTAPAVSAACIPSSDREIQQLQSLVEQDAAKVVTTVQARIEALKDSSPERRAAFYGVLAQAFAILELDQDARKAASAGLALAPRADDPVHIDLLIALSENIYDAEGLTEAVANIESARRGVESGSIADICLTITLGGLQHRQNRDDLAVITLTHVYRASAKRGLAQQRVQAAGMLANVLSSLGDLPQALEMNQEQIDWDTAHEAWLDLSVARYLRGQIYKVMHDYAAAVKEFTEARRLSILLSDRQGVGFADLRICHAQIELQQWTAARQQCRSALEIFTASQSIDVMKEAQALLAQIDLNEGRAREALVALDSVLDKSGADLPPRRVAMVYRLRAQANAALKRHDKAYADLEEYLRHFVEVNDAERTQQSAALRARFETDREIERNASLQRELELGQERWQRQRELLRWTIIGVVAGVFVIVLLTYILIISMRHRRQLSRLASRDALTGVLNRRRVVELATRALADAATSQQPLTVAIIDMDHFKQINDRCGHAVGDYVLQEFARICRESIRGSDIFGRWGGEEFLLVLPKTTLDIALTIMERLRLAALTIQLPASSSAGLRVSLSAGLASNDFGGGLGATTLDDIIAEADAALYEAKYRGRDAVRIADESYRMASTSVREALRSSAGATQGS